MSFTVDSNVLVYAVDRESQRKHELARRVLTEGRDAGMLLTAQAMAEFLNVIRRKFPRFQAEARGEAERWSLIYPVLPTSAGHVLAAEGFAATHKLQLWDSIIWQVARTAGAATFVTEDLQDGLTLEGMTVLDPFNPDNEGALRALLRPPAAPSP